jgi:hypothetical protein
MKSPVTNANELKETEESERSFLKEMRELLQFGRVSEFYNKMGVGNEDK